MSIPYSMAELEAEFVTHAPDNGIGRNVEMASADGLMFLCPKCFGANSGPRGTHRVVCWFRGRVPDGVKPGPGRWDVEGHGLDDVTLKPSVDLTPGNGCNWHGFVTNGSAK